MSFFDDDCAVRDADIEYAELVRQGKRASALKKAGICTHGSRMENPDGTAICLECNKIFPTYDALHQEGRERLRG